MGDGHFEAIPDPEAQNKLLNNGDQRHQHHALPDPHLIMVGVVLDTLQQIESYLLNRHYDGLMKSGRIQSRTASAVDQTNAV